MKRILNYAVCSVCLFVAIVFICGGGLWTLCGFIWSAMLYMSGEAFPEYWKMFWVSNIKILAYFNCL